MKKLLLTFLFLCGFSTVFSQIDYGKSIVKQLSDSAFQGRGYVNGGDSLAARFIADQFKELGLHPVKKDFYQRFSFPINTFPTNTTLTINGKTLKVGQDYLPNEASNSFSGKWTLGHIDSVILDNKSGIVALVDSLQMGEINSVLVRDEDFNEKQKRSIHELIAFLSTYGNVLHLTSSKLTWSASTVQSKHAIVVVPEKAVGGKITSVSSEIQAVFIPKHETQNVVAMIPAQKKSAKYLFFTAHYDHLGRIGDALFPGASDNASGIGMLLSMAKYYTTHPCKYNLVFIAFAGEEAGLIGSKYFVEHPEIPLKKIAFLVNLDLMGNGEDGITVVNGSVFKKQYDLLVKINDEKKYLPVIKSRGKAANSDHYFFTEAGVPSFFIYTLGKNKNYHDIYDVYSDLSFAKFNEIVHLLIDFVDEM